MKYLNTPDRAENILLKKVHRIILLFPLCNIVLKHLKGYVKNNNNNNNNNNKNNNTERKMNMVLQKTERINTPSVLNNDLLNIKLRVTHLLLRYKSKKRPDTHKHTHTHTYIILKLCLCNPQRQQK